MLEDLTICDSSTLTDLAAALLLRHWHYKMEPADPELERFADSLRTVKDLSRLKNFFDVWKQYGLRRPIDLDDLYVVTVASSYGGNLIGAVRFLSRFDVSYKSYSVREAAESVVQIAAQIEGEGRQDTIVYSPYSRFLPVDRL